MDILANIAKTGLQFSHLSVIIPIFLVGFFFIDRKIFCQAFLLVLFSLIYNLFLKSIWQIPLKPPLDGWAFPSGHMHTAWIFWGWLALHFKRFITIPIFLLMMSMTAWGLVYHDYHNLTDIYGSVGFGSLSLLVYYLANYKIPVLKDNFFLVNVILGGFGILLIHNLPIEVQTKAYLWQAQGAIMGMAIGWLFVIKEKMNPKNITQNVVSMVVTIAGMMVIHFLLSSPHPTVTPQNFHFLKMFIMMLWVIAGQCLLLLMQSVAKNKSRNK
tara:strand:- start:1505 stop:2314 length:810 start_codon:yes stop_codon:yes gene_type:complete